MQEMKDFKSTNGCRRASILAHFGVEPLQMDPHNVVTIVYCYVVVLTAKLTKDRSQ